MNGQTTKKYAALGLLGVLLATAGCATISVNSTVAADGTIEEYRIQVNTSTQVYAFMNEGAKDEGYNSLRDQMTSDINESAVENITYDENIEGDSAEIMLKMEGIDTDSMPGINITESDGEMTYHDRIFVNESADPSDSGSFADSLTVVYKLTMPGEITDSNADEVNGNTAEWHSTGSDAMTNTPVRATSDVPITSAFGIPGFGPLALLGALAIITIGVVMLRQS